MAKVKMLIEYDGSNYHGFQMQSNAHTIQAEIETAIYNLTGENCRIDAAGRTDTGVHALGQVIAFKTNASIPGNKWALALNTKLPADIRAHKSEIVNDDFHPRFDALQKTYKYFIYRREIGASIYRNFAYCYHYQLDVEAMQKACTYIKGTHDFRAFCSSGAIVKHYVRQVDECELQETEGWLKLHISANGFLYNMVRIIMGTLLQIGKKRFPASYMQEIIVGQDRKKAGPKVPPGGLYLMEVKYP
jgi:tRNA pseudouridine38-40 synthase